MTEMERLTMELTKAEKSGDMVKWNIIAQRIAELEERSETK